MAHPEPILSVRNLSVTLDNQEILRGISFEAKKGEVLGVIGPNGAGKTVLFRTLLGLLPHEGEIRWGDVRIGYVPQKLFIDRTMPITVREFFLLQSPSFWRPQQKFMEHLNHELSLVGLQRAVLKKPLGELSGGELQRLMIAWAMLPHPDVLLFDEPTSGIDVGSEESIYQVMARLQRERETTILLISHDLNVVYKYAETIICINKRMICYGPPKEVLKPEELERLYGAEVPHHPHH